MTRLLHRFLYETRRAPSAALGAVRGNSIRYYAWHDHPNFGDRLTAPLLRHYGFTPIYTRSNRAEIVVAGSVLDALPQTFHGWILGAGLLVDAPKTFPHARILAVRGELTCNRISATRETTLGDPGLLCGKLLAKRRAKRFRIGLIPHHADRQDLRITELGRRFQPDVCLIDLRRSTAVVLGQIDECGSILSSSLHGLVAADALGIPNTWLCLSDRLVGGRFKFDDYATAVERVMSRHELTGCETITDLESMAQPVAPGVASVKENLDACFRHFAHEFLYK